FRREPVQESAEHDTPVLGERSGIMRTGDISNGKLRRSRDGGATDHDYLSPVHTVSIFYRYRNIPAQKPPELVAPGGGDAKECRPVRRKPGRVNGGGGGGGRPRQRPNRRRAARRRRARESSSRQ